ncbi:ferritin [bacterium]|nr:ferritin [bacterium]
MDQKALISDAMQDSINQQVANELYSSNAYLSIAGYLDSLGLSVMSQRFFEQSDEERAHAMKFVHYLLEVGGDLVINAIPEPANKFKSVREAVAASLQQEKEVTRQINQMMTLARSEDDHATASFLQWFVDEQVEEISTMSNLLQVVEMAGDNLLLVEDRLLKIQTIGNQT